MNIYKNSKTIKNYGELLFDSVAARNPPVEYKKSGRLLTTVYCIVSLFLHVLLEIHFYYQLLQQVFF